MKYSIDFMYRMCPHFEIILFLKIFSLLLQFLGMMSMSFSLLCIVQIFVRSVVYIMCMPVHVCVDTLFMHM